MGSGGIEQLVKSSSEDFNILFNQIGSVIVIFLDDKHKCQIFFHDPECKVLILILVVQFHVGGRSVVVLVSIFVVEVTDIDKDVEHIGADVVFKLIGYLLVVVADVQFGHQVE